MESWNEVTFMYLHAPSCTLFYAWKINLWISISKGYLKIWISSFQITVIRYSDLSDKSGPICKKGPLSHWKMKCLFLGYVQLLMMSRAIWATKVDKKCTKRPPKSSKNEMLIFGLCSTSDDQPSDPSKESWLKCKKGPLSHQKMKCSFLDYVQLLMISQAIWAMKVNQNAKKGPPKSLKNEMLIFGLCSTSDDWPSNLSDKSQPKCRKMPPKSLKNEMLTFGLHSTFDDQLSDPSDRSWPKCTKRPPKSSKTEMLVFGLHSTSDDQLSDLSEESQPKCEKRHPKT